MYFILLVCNAQQQTPKLLKQPVKWQFERFALPPVFAPGFAYKGAEELRFSPGMFNKDSSDYFSYAFVAQLDNTTAITQSEIKNYLLMYFKGLCSSTAIQRKLAIDTSEVTVSIEKNIAHNNAIIYNAVLNVFGVFDDGAAVKLYAEIKVLKDLKGMKTYLVFIASPQDKTNEVWKELYAIQQDFIMPIQNN